MADRICARPGCGRTVSGGPLKIYCSHTCGKLAWAELRARQAKSAAKRLSRSRPAERICLSCGDKFTSEGPWNRICPVCSDSGDRWTRTPNRVVMTL